MTKEKPKVPKKPISRSMASKKARNSWSITSRKRSKGERDRIGKVRTWRNRANRRKRVTGMIIMSRGRRLISRMLAKWRRKRRGKMMMGVGKSFPVWTMKTKDQEVDKMMIKIKKKKVIKIIAVIMR